MTSASSSAPTQTEGAPGVLPLCCRQWGMGALIHAVRISFSSITHEELRATSGRAGSAVGASKTSRSPECADSIFGILSIPGEVRMTFVDFEWRKAFDKRRSPADF